MDNVVATNRPAYRIACLPLLVERRCIGALYFTFEDDGRFEDDERIFWTVLARQCALALERSHLFHLEQVARGEAQAAAERLKALLDTSHAFSDAPLNLAQILDSVSSQVVRHFADGCVIALIRETEREPMFVSTHTRNPEAREVLHRALNELPGLRLGEGIVGKVVSTGRSVLIPVVDQQAFLAAIKPEHRFLADRFPVQTFLAVPLRVQGRPIGALTLVRHSHYRPFTPQDQSLLEEIADRAALSIEGARLHEALQASEARLRFLSEASALLTSAIDSEKAFVSLSQLLVPAIADWCAIDFTGPEGDSRRVVSHESRLPLHAEAPWGPSNVLKEGKPLFTPQLREVPPSASGPEVEHLRSLQQLGLKSFLSVPLLSRGKVLGALSLGQVESKRQYGDADLQLALDLARRMAATVDNAALLRSAQGASRS
jgi:GAF domain-containing protein